MDYFIDECGQTGDLAKSNAMSGFGDQPIFSLAAIGVADDLSLQKEIDRLKTKYDIRVSELKSSARHYRPEFTFEVVKLICGDRYPCFLEVVEKKYFLATHIISRQLLPPIRGLSEDARTHFVKNIIADYLFERAPADVFAKFVEACKSPSDITLSAEFTALIEFAGAAPSDEYPSVAVYELATTALKEYREARDEGREEAFLDYLPVPDDNKHKKPVWVLPNLSAFTNIYARINRYEVGNLSNIRLIHDEQLQFDSILQASKVTAESLQDEAAIFFTPHSDFHFRESASLSFASSRLSTGLQVADILAGFCMRYVKDFFTDGKRVSPLAHQTYDLLRRFTDPENGIGVNLVMSSRWANALSLFTI
jgi:hypothetical protein